MLFINIKKLIVFFFFILYILILNNCNKKELDKENFYLLIDKGFINLENIENNDIFFNITSNEYWEITTNVDWLTIKPNSGFGNLSINVAYTKNQNPNIRKATISIKLIKTSETKKIEIYQLGIENVLQAIPTKTSFEGFINIIPYINITSNVSWLLETSSSWLQLQNKFGKNSAQINFYLDNNNSDTDRNTSIFITNLYNNEKKEIKIFQKSISKILSPFKILQPTTNNTFFKNLCNNNANTIPIEWQSSINSNDKSVLYDIYLDKTTNPQKIIYSDLKELKSNINFSTLDYGKYYIQIIAKSELNNRKSNIDSFNISFTEYYSKYITVAGNNTKGNSPSQFNYCSDLYVDDNQNIYIADQLNLRIQKWNNGSNFATTIASLNDFIPFAIQPHSVVIDNAENIYISTLNNSRIIKVNPFNKSYLIIVNGKFMGIKIKNNFLYACDIGNNCIKKFNLNNSNQSGEIIAGSPYFVGNNGLNQFSNPHNLFIDDNEDIYVADENNNRIMLWKKGASSGIVLAGNNGGGNALNQLNKPRSIILDDCKNMYICDYGNNRIIKWVIGEQNGIIISKGLISPHSMTYEKNGDIYIADDALNVIQKWFK